MLNAVAEILTRRRSAGWLVGGSVRDRMMGRSSPDLDVAVADNAAAVAREVAGALHAPWFALSERHPAFRVLGPEGYVDVAAVRGGGIEADLALRDFTVNAMAVPVAMPAAVPVATPSEDGLIDPFDGAAHLRERRLVAVSEHIFSDDPLRLMRAPRFCHMLGLRLDTGLAARIREEAAALSRAAAERVVTEMCLTLAAGRAAEAAGLWEELGLLAVVLPELPPAGATAVGVRADLLDRLDEMLERPAEWFPEAAGLLAARLAESVDGTVTRPVALRLAALLHRLGAQEVRAVTRRLKLSGAMTSLLEAMARSATGPMARAAGLAGLLPADASVTRAAVLFLWDVAPWEPEVIMLAGAAEPEGEAARHLLVLHARRAGEGVPFPLDGEMLMRELGLESGPLLGRVLREARLAWEAGEVAEVDEVLAVARRVATPR